MVKEVDRVAGQSRVGGRRASELKDEGAYRGGWVLVTDAPFLHMCIYFHVYFLH